MIKSTFLKSWLLLLCMIVGVSYASAQTTYKLTQVTSVEEGGLYVFEQDGYVMNNTVSSSALQTTNSYKTSGLTGTETYVWTLETISTKSGFRMKNISKGTNSPYLTNASSTIVSFQNTSSASFWTFDFQSDGTVIIQNVDNGNRFLGYTGATSHAYKAYAVSNLGGSTYPHAIKVYKLEDETSLATLEDNDLALTGNPIDLTFDLYNNNSAQVINYTTSSTGTITVNNSEYISAVVDETNKTITVTPLKKTPSAQTITVSQAADDTYKAGSATFTVNIANSAPATIYEKVTDASTLQAGDKLLLVCESKSKAIGVVSGTYYTGVDVTIDNNTISISGEEVNELTLGGSVDSWTLLESMGGKYLAWNSGNALNSADDATANSAKWSISINEGNVTIANVGDNTRVIKWNAGSPRFACYTTAQTDIQLYRIQDSSRADAELSFSVSEVNVAFGGSFTPPTLNTAAGFNGTVEYSSSDESVAQVMDTETGELRIIAGGTTIITASFAGNNDFKAGSASYTLNVTDNRIATTITQDNIVLDIAAVNTLAQLAPVVKDANDNVVAYDNTGALPEVYFNLDNDENGIIGSLGGNGEITLNSVVGTATITATYNHFNENTTYKPSSCTFTITVESVLSIEDARAQSTGDVITTKGVVTSVNGKTAYIQDATAAIVVFGTSNLTCVVGDEIKVSGTLTDYNGLLEIKDPTYTVLSQNNTVTPEVMTIADINASTNQGWLVKIEGATVTEIDSKNVTIEQGGESIVVRFNDTNDITFAVNDVITLTGNIGCYYTAQIANPTDISVAADTTPSVTVSETEINVDAAEHVATITVTYANISDIIADVVFCDATGAEAPAKPTWITADINSENDIYYVISANTGEARTAYMKVYALDDDANDVYSELITITQAAPVVDYATLPFDWAGGASADFLALDGVSANGLGKDYATTNAPYNIKFDTTDDYIQIKTDGQILNVTAEVKMLGGATASSITVQSSADGTTFTDVQELEISGAQNAVLSLETTQSFDANDRYVRLVFTKGSNVGVGAITINCVRKTISDVGYATYCSANNLDFSNVSGLTAYEATIDGTTVAFNEGDKVFAAGEGILLKGNEGTYTIPVIASATANTNNKLVGVLADTEVAAGIYVLLNTNNNPGFYKTKNAFTVGAHTAYLPAIAGAREFIGIDDNTTTGVNSIDNGQWTMDNVYNLNGQRVNNAKKGLYIVNGKKVVIK